MALILWEYVESTIEGITDNRVNPATIFDVYDLLGNFFEGKLFSVRKLYRIIVIII